MPCTIGGEQEYAIGFSSDQGEHPGNQLIYRELLHAVADSTKTVPSGDAVIEQPNTPLTSEYSLFTENGGSFNYERLSFCLDGGLLEASTPECADANELALYLKAQERQLIKAIPKAEKTLAAQGFAGKIHLVKSCLDSESNHFGAQENYEAPLAGSKFGIVFLQWFIGTISLPLLLILIVAEFIGELWSFIPLSKYLELHFTSVARRKSRFTQNQSLESQMSKRAKMRIASRIGDPINGAIMALFFRPQKKALRSFMITRIIFSGSGSVDDEGQVSFEPESEESKYLLPMELMARTGRNF